MVAKTLKNKNQTTWEGWPRDLNAWSEKYKSVNQAVGKLGHLAQCSARPRETLEVCHFGDHVTWATLWPQGFVRSGSVFPGLP
jgi:hypothetical protein